MGILHQKTAFEELEVGLKRQEVEEGKMDDQRPTVEVDDDEELSTAPQLLQSTGLKLCLELIKFYDKKIEDMNSENHVLSAETVCAMIQTTLRTFPRSFLGNNSLNELKFSYIEESHPEEFFIPYVWHLCYTT